MQTDGRWDVLKIAVAGLIAVGAAAVICVTFLVARGREAPDGLVALASAAVGALATLMTTSGTRTGGE